AAQRRRTPSAFSRDSAYPDSPQCFEGLLAVAEDADALELATCEVVDIGSRQLVGDSDSTRSPGRADAHGGEDLIAANALQALDPYSEVGTRVTQVGPEPAARILTFVHPS